MAEAISEINNSPVAVAVSRGVCLHYRAYSGDVTIFWCQIRGELEVRSDQCQTCTCFEQSKRSKPAFLRLSAAKSKGGSSSKRTTVAGIRKKTEGKNPGKAVPGPKSLLDRISVPIPDREEGIKMADDSSQKKRGKGAQQNWDASAEQFEGVKPGETWRKYLARTGDVKAVAERLGIAEPTVRSVMNRERTRQRQQQEPAQPALSPPAVSLAPTTAPVTRVPEAGNDGADYSKLLGAIPESVIHAYVARLDVFPGLVAFMGEMAEQMIVG